MQEQFPDADIEAKYKELRAEYGSARKVREALEAEYGQRLSPDVVNRYSPDSYYTYTQLRNIMGQPAILEAHHLLEKQFASLFGVCEDDIISVGLTPMWHRNVHQEKGRKNSNLMEGANIDKLIDKELKKLTKANSANAAKSIATVEQVWQAHRNVYEKLGYEEWANAIYEIYVEPMGFEY